jgi:hypothetical protein
MVAACTLESAIIFYYMTNSIGNQSTLEGFFKRKLPPAGDNENNNGDTSRAEEMEMSLQQTLIVLFRALHESHERR